MYKKTKNLIIILLINFIMLITNLLSTITYAENHGNHCFVTYGVNYAWGRNEITDWNEINTVWIDQSAANAYYTLNQKNVFCVEHGTDITNGYKGWYSPGEEFEITDPGLQFILYGSVHYGVESSTWKNNYQKALWSYLDDNKRSNANDIKKILEGISIAGDSYNYESLTNDGLNFNDYVELQQLAPSIRLSRKNDSQVTVGVSGCLGDYQFEHKIGNGSITSTTESLRNFDVNVASNMTYEAKVIDTISTYQVKCRLLKKNDSQRLLVVTYTNKIDTSKSAYDNLSEKDKPNVSIQKYVVAVDNKVVNKDGTIDNGTTYDTSVANKVPKNNNSSYNKRRRMCTYASENNYRWVKDIAATVSDGVDGVRIEGFKNEVPVQIEDGSYVTYKIIVYNSSDTTATDVVIRDRLPSFENSSGGNSAYASIKGIYNEEGTSVKNKWKLLEGESKPTYEYTIASLPKGYTYFLMTVCYDQLDEGITGKNLTNSAWVETVGNENKEEYRRIDRDYVRYKTDVSLQKYIIKVDDVDINDRSNQMTARTDTGVNSTISSTLSADTSKFKYDNPVEIGKNSTVTYRISVYNNSNVNARNVCIKDTLPNYATIESIKLGSYDLTDEVEISGNIWKYGVNISAGSAKYFSVKLKFTNAAEAIHTNTVEIESVANVNKCQYRIKDRDYVIVKNYSVSLEKYVSYVTNGAGGDGGTPKLTDRNDRNVPIYTNNNLKRNNPVRLEIGDIVTYKIILRVKEGSGSLRVYKLTDTFTNNSNCKLTILDGDNNTANGITVLGNGNGTYSSGAINFANPTLIAAGGSVEITVKFKVEISTSSSSTRQTLLNTATIDTASLKNSLGVPVSDADTSDNTDTDWVKTKIYAVGLEKYITQVNANNITTTNNVKELVDRQGHPHRGSTLNQKKNDPVLINKGDTITYTIRITNTGNNTTDYGRLEKVVITDTRLLGDSQTEYLEYESIANVRKYSGENAVTTGIKENITYTAASNSAGTITYDAGRSTTDNVGPINVEAWVEFDIIFKVKNTTPQGSLLENRAEISNIINKNNATVADSKETTDKDNKDSDWVKIRVTSVAIQKFVTEVKSLDGTDPVSYTDRVNHRYNEDTSVPTTDTENKDPFKKNDYVEVEKGDIVTFTIRLQNTGELPVTITKIYDSYTYYSTNNEKLKDTGLIYDSISGTGDPKILDYEYGNQGTAFKRYLIGFDNPVVIQPRSNTQLGYIDIQIKFKVDSTVRGKVDLRNKAAILEMRDSYGNLWSWDGVTESSNGEVYRYMSYIQEGDYDGPNNNYDMDFLEVQTYKVSLQKIAYNVTSGEVNKNVENSLPNNASRWNSWESHANTCVCGINSCIDSNNDGKCDNCENDAWYNTIEKDASQANEMVNYIHSSERQGNTYSKHNNPVTVANEDLVTYAVRVKNDGDKKVKITKIIDKLPAEVTLVRVEDSNHTELEDGKDYECDNNVLIIYPNHKTRDGLLPIGENGTDTYYITVKVNVSTKNMSVDVLRNEAYIEEIENKNQLEVLDLTTADNQDADYIQLKDIVISGTVWNDNALNKQHNKYDGLIDADERKLGGITVRLYREGIDLPIATTTTTDSGIYTFDNSMIDPNVVNEACAQFIKGPYKCKEPNFDATNDHSAKYWAGTYYSYYVVFEYDGVTYTSTTINDWEKCLGAMNNEYDDSNAKEDNAKGKSGLTSRDNFNDGFGTINNQSGIDYTTINGEDTIPESIHNEKDSEGKLLYKMQSSTERIDLDEYLEEQLKHVNLGLRGRDIFDLELITDVYQIQITVNGEENTYKYANKVKLRKSDLTSNTVIDEDMANIISEKDHKYVDSYDQNIRETDLDVIETRSNYKQTQGVSNIEVTYKITVQNTSITDGIATKIIDYYDTEYTFVKAYSGESDLLYTPGNETDNYKSVIISTPETKLSQSETMDIYVVYELNPTQKNPIKYENIINVNKERGLATYNMAEITEYITTPSAGQTKYTVGLIDKDSAPGSAESEDVRLDPDRVGDVTTVEYYFAAQSLDDLVDLEYEDDTYAAPIIYYVKDNSILTNQRKISGVVFEDKTEIDPTTKIKTGNGKQELSRNEVGVYGVTVHLIEQTDLGEVLRYITTTGTDGSFEFKGFLPGKYIIRYYYGNSEETVLQNKATAENGTKVNQKSYNGEDFQATNNSYEYNFADRANYKTTYKLDRTDNFWYVFNEKEGISSGFDNIARRQEVSTNVTNFTDEQMTLLNNIRDGKNDPHIIDGVTLNLQTALIDKTYMYADTQSMKFTVEETVNVNELENKDALLSKINIIQKDTDKGILLGQWAVYPGSDYYEEYKVENMNFGIAEVPVTKFDLQKHVSEFTIKDSTGKNVIAKISKVQQEDGTYAWEKVGDVITDLNGKIDVSIEDEKLQGSKLEVRYTISVTIDAEVNYDRSSCVVPKITGVADFVNNNLSYNANLIIEEASGGEAEIRNSKYWEVTTYTDIKTQFANQIEWDGVTAPVGTVDPEGKVYTTVLKAKTDNPLLDMDLADGSASVDIILEKVLSSTNTTIEEIITSTVDTYEYGNIVEIIGFDYVSGVDPSNPTPDPDPETPDPVPGPGSPDPDLDPDKPMRDRVRTLNRYIIIPGVQHDSATSETIVIHPPTGTTEINTMYYIVAIVALAVLAAGVYSIKKFVIKK